MVIVTVGSFVFSVAGQGFLTARGRQIVDGSGKEVILRGMGLGGWMLQEGYMYHLGFLGQQYRIREKIEASVGPGKAAWFYDQWLRVHTTGEDIDRLAALGFNSIRLPMHYALYTLPVDKEPVAGQDTWIEKGFVLTDSLLSWCRRNRMYLILDLHAAPGGQGNDLAISDRDPSKPSLWESEANRHKTIALWKKIAARYAHEPWVGGYDILNETNWGFDNGEDRRGTEERRNIPLKALLQDITKAIREVDPSHLIIIEGNGFGNNYNGMLPAWDANMALSFHKYGNFNNRASIQRFLNLRDRYNIPLWLGESGENSNTWFTEAIRLAEEHRIGWAWWQHKKMGISNPFEIKEPEGYDRLLADWSGKGPKLPEAEAWSILTALLEQVKIRHNVFHPDVADAMFRQTGAHTAIPFSRRAVDGAITISAADYDLGAQRVAYFDTDSASYHYTPGVNTVGNRGRSYRNDGVDIREENNRYPVFATEAGEWLQYTLTVKKAGRYRFQFQTRAENDAGAIRMVDNGRTIIPAIALPAAGKNWARAETGPVRLGKGVHRLRVVIEKGGFDFLDWTLTREK